MTKMLELRIKRGLTRNEISEVLMINPREYEMIELGIKEISEELKTRIRNLLEIRKG
jgi:transcriptional regulator with XRE-family HTH domain